MSESKKVNWDTMAEVARRGRKGIQELLAEHKQTVSPEIAGSLIGVITEARRKGWVSPLEAVKALIELLNSLNVWEMASRHIPASMLGAFETAVYEDGLPEGADRVVPLQSSSSPQLGAGHHLRAFSRRRP